MAYCRDFKKVFSQPTYRYVCTTSFYHIVSIINTADNQPMRSFHSFGPIIRRDEKHIHFGPIIGLNFFFFFLFRFEFYGSTSKCFKEDQRWIINFEDKVQFYHYIKGLKMIFTIFFFLGGQGYCICYLGWRKKYLRVWFDLPLYLITIQYDYWISNVFKNIEVVVLLC